MNMPLVSAALRVSERFIEAELKVRERSYGPTPTVDESYDIQECAEALHTVKRAIVDMEVGA